MDNIANVQVTSRIAQKLVLAYDNAEITHDAMALAIVALVKNPPSGSLNVTKRTEQLIHLGKVRAEGKG